MGWKKRSGSKLQPLDFAMNSSSCGKFLHGHCQRNRRFRQCSNRKKKEKYRKSGISKYTDINNKCRKISKIRFFFRNYFFLSSGNQQLVCHYRVISLGFCCIRCTTKSEISVHQYINKLRLSHVKTRLNARFSEWKTITKRRFFLYHKKRLAFFVKRSSSGAWEKLAKPTLTLAELPATMYAFG